MFDQDNYQDEDLAFSDYMDEEYQEIDSYETPSLDFYCMSYRDFM